MEAGNGLIAERAYAELRSRIVTLRLPPGTLLREDELMRELGIGRTPLREAVKRLALENLVAVQPRSGTFVTGVKLKLKSSPATHNIASRIMSSWR